jgi:hypothetical protein
VVLFHSSGYTKINFTCALKNKNHPMMGGLSLIFLWAD